MARGASEFDSRHCNAPHDLQAGLSSTQYSLDDGLWHAVNGVNLFHGGVPKQAEPSRTEAGVPHIDHITRSICDATLVGILGLKDELNETIAINPVDPADDRQTTQHPPAVTHVFLLLRPAIQPAARDLSLAEPLPQLLLVNKVEPFCDRQGSNAGEDLARVRLRTRSHAISAVKVGTGRDIRDCSLYIYQRGEP